MVYHQGGRLSGVALYLHWIRAFRNIQQDDIFLNQEKCGGRLKEVWPYIKQEIKPTLDELGILTPEEMGYDKPELALKDVYDM